MGAWFPEIHLLGSPWGGGLNYPGNPSPFHLSLLASPEPRGGKSGEAVVPPRGDPDTSWKAKALAPEGARRRWMKWVCGAKWVRGTWDPTRPRRSEDELKDPVRVRSLELGSPWRKVGRSGDTGGAQGSLPFSTPRLLQPSGTTILYNVFCPLLSLELLSYSSHSVLCALEEAGSQGSWQAEELRTGMGSGEKGRLGNRPNALFS